MACVEPQRHRGGYIISIVSLLHVSATIVAILREVNYKRYITKVDEPMHRCKNVLTTRPDMGEHMAMPLFEL